MADDFDDDDILEGAEQSTPASGKSKTGLFIILIIGVLIVIVGAVVAFFLLKNVGGGSGPASAPAEMKMTEPVPEPLGEPILFKVGDIYINVPGTRSTRVLKFTPYLEVNELRMKTELEKFGPLLKDRIAMVARGMSFDELDGVQGPERLKQGIRDTLNSQLRHRLQGVIIAVHFDDFLIQ